MSQFVQWLKAEWETLERRTGEKYSARRLSIEAGLVSFENSSHPPFANLLDNLVLSQGLPNQALHFCHSIAPESPANTPITAFG